MRLVILAAGAGSRMGSIAKHKSLLEFGDRTLIQRAVDTFYLDEPTGQAAVCVGCMAGEVAKSAKSTYPEWAQPKFYFNAAWAQTGAAYSLLCAKDFWLGQDCIIMEGDILFHPTIMAELLHCPFPNCIPVDTRAYPEFGEETLAIIHGHMVAGMVWPGSQMTIGEAVVMAKVSAYRTQRLLTELPYHEEIIAPLVMGGSFHFHPVEVPWAEIDTSEDLDFVRDLYQEHKEDFK